MKTYIHIVFISAVLLLNSCSCHYDKNKQTVVKNGIADISSWNFSSEGIIELNGNWEFYYGRLLEPGDITPTEAQGASYINVPDSWDSFLFNGKKIGSYGHSTYRLKIFTGSDRSLFLKIMPPNSAYRIWINGTFLYECGKVGDGPSNEIPAYRFEVIEVKPVNGTIEIVMQVSNYSIYLGGLQLPAKIGLREDIYSDKENRIAFDMFIFASLLVISIYYCGLFIMRKTEKSHLFFSIFTLMLSIRSLIINEMFIYQIFPHAHWQLFLKMDFLVTTLCVPVFIFFIYLLYPAAVKKKVMLFFNISAALYSSVIVFTKANTYSHFLPAFNIITIAACLYVVHVLAKAVKDRQEGAKLALCGFLILFVTVINDILVVNNMIYTIQLSSFGVFSFILMQSFISSMKFANAYKSIEELSHNLETKVAERTGELEKEKELLRVRNETIENELIIAKKIQKQIIPRHSPVENIHVFYKPMDKVGGDFYDFLRYRDSDKIGIFLSDVSGHGVPAAFITSMVKTSILQAGANRENPSSLLSSLNELLLNQTGGHFVTAFYGIFNPQTRELIYSNFGHNPPFIISPKSVDIIDGQKSLPLAILNNQSLHAINKGGSNNSIILDKGNKILFYTDGLTEAVSKNDQNAYFENVLVSDLIPEYAVKPPGEFIARIYDELVKFHGSDSFEDDICMICMEVE